MMNFEIVEETRLFDEFLKVDKVILNHDTHSGGKLSNICRYVLHRPAAVGVVLENITTKKIILVQQLRFPVARFQNNGWLTEIIAGLIDEGESPEECARREVMEEVGYKVDKLELIMDYCPNVGISDEQITLYYGQVTSDDKIAEGGGLDDESEDILIIEKDIDDLFNEVQSGKIIDGKSIVALQWLALKKRT